MELNVQALNLIICKKEEKREKTALGTEMS